MKPAEKIENLIKKSRYKANPEAYDKALNSFLQAVDVHEKQKSAITEPNIWRIIMKSRITKLAAAAVIIIAVLFGIKHFGGPLSGGNVAFADVLKHIQSQSYTFDLTIDPEFEDSINVNIKAMIFELGQVRMDCSTPVGEMSLITDFTTEKNLLLFHENNTAAIKEEPVLNKSTGAQGMFVLFTRPIDNLWNMRDGTEEQLGEKEINGQPVTGFKVLQEDEYFQYDMRIWVDTADGVPRLVEITSKALDGSISIKWTMENFDLNVDLDEELFSLEVPAGYTLAYQGDLENLQVDTKPSTEAEKIEQMFELWLQGRKDETIKILLSIEWTEQIEFGKEPYLFSMTEKGYIALKDEDQKQVMEDIMTSAVAVRQIIKQEVVRLGQEAVSSNNYETAEQYYEAGLQLGKLIARNPEAMIIVRLVGIGVEKVILNEMISLYTTMNNEEKLRTAEKQLQEVEAEAAQIKNKALGQ
jgi:outer membrane lipoprotein-sorting protein